MSATEIKRTELETKFLAKYTKNIRLVEDGLIRIVDARRETVNDREVLVIRLEAVGQSGSSALKSPAAASIASRVSTMEGGQEALDLRSYSARPVAMEKQIKKQPVDPADLNRFYIDYRARVSA